MGVTSHVHPLGSSYVTIERIWGPGVERKACKLQCYISPTSLFHHPNSLDLLGCPRKLGSMVCNWVITPIYHLLTSWDIQVVCLVIFYGFYDGQSAFFTTMWDKIVGSFSRHLSKQWRIVPSNNFPTYPEGNITPISSQYRNRHPTNN